MESRTKKSKKNILTGFVAKILLLVLSFSTKTTFVRLLGAEFNGVNGLYSNILTVLSLADLGVANYLTFTLYQALKEQNEKKLVTLTYEFRVIYRRIGFGVLGIGLSLVPLLKYVINSSLPLNELRVYYILFLLNSVVSYFAVYKTTIISADQKNYISEICTTICTALMYGLQIFYLKFTKDFFGYLLIQVLFTVIRNVVMTYIADRKYPYLRNKHLVDKTLLADLSIFENLKSTFIYKICVVLINNTDNILISILVGTIYVGYYSNYHAVYQYVNTFISIITTGVVASLGNLNAEHNAQKSFKVFNMLGLLYSTIAIFCVCCYATCIQGFIPIWLGKEYLLDRTVVVALILVWYISTSISPVFMFRETMGLFKEVKCIMVLAMLLNIIFSIVLGKLMGISGIIFATSIAKISTHYWYEPKLLFETRFNKKVSEYFLTQLKYAVSAVISLALCLYITAFLPEGLFYLMLKVAICLIVVGITVIIFNCKTEVFHDLMKKITVLI